MTALEQIPDALRHDIPVRLRGVEQIDLHQALAVEHAERPPDGDEDGIIQVEAQHLALGLHDADHAVRLPTDTHPLAQGRFIAEKLPLQCCTQHCKSAAASGFLGR